MKPRASLTRLIAVLAFMALWVGGDAMIAAHAEPPPWAPAHGYRAKHKAKHKHKHKHKRRHSHGHDYDRAALAIPDVGIDLGSCNRDILGGIIGGAAGGIVGSQIGQGDGNTVAIIAGTAIGALIGGAIGRHMDEVDQACVGQALEQAGTGQRVTWHDPDRTTHYAVTPTKTYQRADQRYCREYTAEAIVGNEVKEVYGTACRQADGSWQLMN